MAYGVQSYQMTGWPGWTRLQSYAIEATTAAPVSPTELRRMLQTLLAERFQLRVHRETKEWPVYGLVVAQGGSKLPLSTTRCGADGCIDVAPGIAMKARFAKAEDIAHTLSNMVERPVVDRTGLTGRYDYRIEFGPKRPLPKVLEQELGLRLEPISATIELLVVDSVAR